MPHDPPDPDQPKATLPAFTPVPRLKDRHNGWKPEVQRAFIDALAETGSVKAACRRVGRSDHGAYLLRRPWRGKPSPIARVSGEMFPGRFRPFTGHDRPDAGWERGPPRSGG